MGDTQQSEQGKLTLFNDSITEQGLKEFRAKAESLPSEIEDKDGYVWIYKHYQDVRKLRIAIDKKLEELIKNAKSDFETKKEKIHAQSRLIYVVILPIGKKLKQIRETYESEEKQKAEEKARIEAEKQKAEFNRQEILRVWDQAELENQDFDQNIEEEIRRVDKDHEEKKEMEDRVHPPKGTTIVEMSEDWLKENGVENIDTNLGKVFSEAVGGVTAKEAIENFEANTKAVIDELSHDLIDMELTTATLLIELNVSCPNEECPEYFDLLNTKGISRKWVLESLFDTSLGQNWSDLHEKFDCDVICPSCKKEFNVKGIEW